MTEITAGLVKELREKSGAGMMDCKKALQENAGDIDASMDWLRTKACPRRPRKPTALRPRAWWPSPCAMTAPG